MSKLRLSLACWNYDRTQGLMEGRIPVDGIDLICHNLPVEETFFRMLRYQEFDVAEMSLSSYSVTLLAENPRFIAIPVFLSRSFRHASIYVNCDSGIREPKDLIGKRIGTPEYQMTAPVWIRGIMQDEYGVKVTDPRYYTGGEEEPGRSEKLKLSLPPEIHVEPIAADKTLSQMLESGEIDALYTARTPSCFSRGSAKVRRLFPNYQEVERQYFRKTKIFPIMHVVVIRREIYEKYPWVAQSLYKAFVQAQQEIYQQIHQTAALRFMLPWLIQHVAETEEVMGRDFWSYGFEPNEHVLSTFLKYHHEQGLSKRLLAPRELFAAETFEAFKI